ncbi:CsgG/HfaB family protein [Chlorobaculum tepidum]|uniref:CsgG/HfaB family protein n=1 Tax=Chlorobaculum tepidum TaxID=1097 RepID=UPI002220C02A|nr:CsgG/HfaB family protein [Chlorobaculum tepidum]
MLISELASTNSFRVLERKELDTVLDEQDLGRSGRIDPRTRAKVGKITGAKYLVVATSLLGNQPWWTAGHGLHGGRSEGDRCGLR